MAHNTSELIYKLCAHITKQPDEVAESSFRFALHALSQSPMLHSLDEFVIVEKIKKKLVRHGRQKDALAFAELYRKLQTSNALRNRTSVLALLFSLYEEERQYDRYAQFANELAHIVAAVPEISLHANGIIASKPIRGKNIVAQTVKAENQLQNQRNILNAELNGVAEGKTRVARVAALFAKKDKDKRPLTTWSSVKQQKQQVNGYTSESNHSGIEDAVQNEILRDVIYIVQGISGKDIFLKQNGINFDIGISDSVKKSGKKLILRFAEMGWMLTKIVNFCSKYSSENSAGLILQSFVAAVQEELLEYYRILAVIEAQLQNKPEVKGHRVCLPLTLHRLSVWFQDPFLLLQILASVVDSSLGIKGGALASMLFSYLQRGDKVVYVIIKRLLVATIQPLYRMLSTWIFNGELEDTYEEFFVVANLTYPESNMWQEKYSLNKAMIPSFLSMDQARKILSTGKAINFLRQVCKDHSFVKDSEFMKKKHDSKTIQSLFIQENDSEFHLLLEKNYQKTSSLVLNVLYNDYKLMAHFQAMRNYLLLGQGDFIRHIMDLLESDLGKPAHTLYDHILSGIVESAIRATNAQYHDPDILQCLEGKLMESSIGDTGWDVFTLNYKIDGPIATVFTPSCMASYLRLFKCLWRAKHMEYLLSNICRSRNACIKIQEQIPATIPVAHKCHVILAQMVHFVQQMQYYNAFEVMECSWADLLQKIGSAQDLDEIISAHEMFLDTLLTRSLLNEESVALKNQLRVIYNLIVCFQKMQDKFWSGAQEIVNVMKDQDKLAESNTLKGSWGVTEDQTSNHKILMEHFLKEAIPNMRAELRVLSDNYETMVQQFLLMLNDHQDQNLRFLSFRLDFNEHFKDRNSQLHSSLTFLHRRRSAKFV